MLPDNLRPKAARVVADFERGSVSERDVELLLIWLREVADPSSAFREIAHFIAHSKRDCGETFEALYKLYCRWRAYSLYQHKKQQLDLSSPLEQWFIDFLLYQTDELGSAVLEQKIGLSRKAARRLINDSFQKTKGSYSWVAPRSGPLVTLINEAFSFIRVSTLYDQNQVLESFFATLEKAGLISSRAKLHTQSRKILLCLLALMSKRTFHIGKDVIGHTILTAPVDGFGKMQPLELRGHIKVPAFPGILVTLIQTDLNSPDWVHPELLIQKETNLKGHYWTVFDEAAYVQATEKEGRFVLSKHEQA
jgi:hypothetical protein